MTPTEMLARIAELEGLLSHGGTATSRRNTCPTVRQVSKAAERARRRQFKLDRWRRERRHLSLNRYAIQH
jgi:hypothetical protein